VYTIVFVAAAYSPQKTMFPTHSDSSHHYTRRVA
jgi:hypothetical protein